MTLCCCGCQREAAPGSKYAQAVGKGNCKMQLFERLHPRLDLSGLDPVAAKRAERMVVEAVKAAKLGQSRATVDADVEVSHGRDERPSRRVRLHEEEWRMLEEIVQWSLQASKSCCVGNLIRRRHAELLAERNQREKR